MDLWGSFVVCHLFRLSYHADRPVCGPQTNQLSHQATSVAMHYFIMASFFWMLAEALQLRFSFIDVFPSRLTIARQHIYYMILGWMTPAVIVTVSASVSLDHYTTSSYCWIDGSTSTIWAFLAPAALVLAINMSLWLQVLVAVRRCGGNTIALRACISLGVLVGLTWVFGLLVSATSNSLVLQFAFAIANSLQGVRGMEWGFDSGTETEREKERERGCVCMCVCSLSAHSAPPYFPLFSNFHEIG